MSKKTSKPISRREHDQMKRNRMNNTNNSKPASDNRGIIEKCKGLLRKKNSEN